MLDPDVTVQVLSGDYAGFTHGGNFQGQSFMYPDGLGLVGSILGIPTGAVRLNTGYAEQNPKRMLD